MAVNNLSFSYEYASEYKGYDFVVFIQTNLNSHLVYVVID